MPSKFQKPASLLLATVMLAGMLAAIRPATAAAAAPSQEVSVSPFLQEVRISGSEPTKNFDISYTNDSSKNQTLVLSVVDFGSLDQTGGVAFAGSGLSQLFDKYTLSHWLILPNNNIVLAPGQKTTVTPVISNEGSLAPGGHYAAIVATVLDPDSGSSNNVSVKQKISSLVLAVKTGGEKYDLSLAKIQTNGNLLRLPDQVDLTIRGTGNTHVVPRGVVTLKDGNKIISRGVINQESSFLLPATTRDFTSELHQLSKPSWLHHSLTLQVDYRYDGLDKFATKTVMIRYYSAYFWTVIFLIIAVLVVAWRHFRKPPGRSSAK